MVGIRWGKGTAGGLVQCAIYIHFREVAPGKGSLDYTTCLKRLAELPQRPLLMLGHLTTAEEYAAAREHAFEVSRKAGLSFG